MTEGYEVGSEEQAHAILAFTDTYGKHDFSEIAARNGGALDGVTSERRNPAPASPPNCAETVDSPLYQQLADRLTSQESIIQELRADKERLDWMEANPRGCAIRHAPNEWGVTDTEMLGKNHRGPTLREAIDLARNADKGEV